MNNCIEIKELLSLYLDNELDEDRKKQVETHLQQCDACKKEFEELTFIKNILAETEEVSVPDVFDERLHAALKAESMRMKKKTPNLKRFTSIAAIFVVGLFAVSLYNNSSLLTDGFDKYFDTNSSQSIESSVPENASNDSLESDLDTENAGSTGDAGDTDNVTLNTKTNEETIASTSPRTTQGSEDAGSADTNVTENESDAFADTETTGTVDDAENVNNTDNDVDNVENGAVGSDAATCAEQESGVTGSAIPSRGDFSTNEREKAAIEMYKVLLEELLIGQEYQLVDIFQNPEGVWNLQVKIITTSEDGDIFEQTVYYKGQDGVLECVDPSQILNLKEEQTTEQ